MDTPIYLRRLKTKDGIVGPIEVVFEPRLTERRAVREPLMAAYSEVTAGAEMPQVRRYQLRRQVTCVLFEMEEE